ncbi:hypothetical protein E8E12_001161 [Didymella heteroderae]|uniref:Major facilitator superfamily (MFS) profile domain-containing protein n=1 Tax=Didymella heteroderae TaxID=1769908 RepID=A0A9P4WJ26_9PLEO|nr:hypothetical protein E8E12_001161 [Didymella heteroderae]
MSTNQSMPIGGNRGTGTLRGSQQSDATLPGDDPEQHGVEQSDKNSGAKRTEEGKTIVELEDDNDPIDPHNWPLLKRARTMLILSMLVFTQAWAGACDSLGNSKASTEYHVSPVAEDLATAMYLFGIGSGCLFVGPLSQALGRNPVYLGFTLVYLCFILGTSLAKNYASQVVLRYLAGLASSAALGINGASVGDMFRPVERALWFPVIAWVNVAPPVLAPIVGGWVANHNNLNWQWIDWITLFISAFAFVIAFFFLPETYLPMLLGYKATHLRRLSVSKKYVTEHKQNMNFFTKIEQILPLSFKFSATEPAILSLGGFLVLLYIILFTFLSGFEYIFKRKYNLNDFEEGACFASIALGTVAFSLTSPALYSWTRRDVGYADCASVTPEFRLWPAMITSPLLPISLFWLGWTDYSSISIYSGLAACFCFGIVLNAMYVSSYEYIIDSYGEKASIALASVTMMRYLIAGGMVMAARPMYENIGVHWTMTLLGPLNAPQPPTSIPWQGGKGWRAGLRNFFAVTKTKEWLAAGYEKYSKKNKAFVLPAVFSAQAEIVLPRSQMSWMFDQPDYVLSSKDAHYDFLQGKYAFIKPNILRDPYHEHVIHKNLVRNLNAIIPDLEEEIPPTVDAVWGMDTEVFEDRLDELLLEDDPPAHQPHDVLPLVPKALHPVVGNLAGLTSKYHFWQASRFTLPLIEERLEHIAKKDAGDPEYKDWKEPHDFITWSYRTAQAEGRTDEMQPNRIAQRIMPLNFAAIHTTSITAYETVANILTASPEVVESLREEASRVLQEEGSWTKKGLSRMHRMDSAIRESQRISPIGLTFIARKVVAKEGVTTPEGVYLKYGTIVSCPWTPIAMDDELHKDAAAFDAFRYSRAREDPGRFFVSYELKMIFAHLLLNYDFRPLKEKPKKALVVRTEIPMPVAVEYKRRNTVWQRAIK